MSKDKPRHSAQQQSLSQAPDFCATASLEIAVRSCPNSLEIAGVSLKCRGVSINQRLKAHIVVFQKRLADIVE